MTKLNQVYRCPICGNIVEVLHTGVGQLVCCGQPMELLAIKEKDVGYEKHLPVIEKTTNGFIVKVGSISHPMEKEHYIEFIELIADGEVYRKFLNPGDDPMASFEIKSDNITARIYCNIHGIWQSK